MIANLKSKMSHYCDIFYNKYYPMQILHRNRQRKRLVNRRFSLLTGNCVGGYIYHLLGLKFLSPTINLMIENQDFVKFLLNIDYYISVDPIPYIDCKYPDVPSAKLDDIIIHFTHYKNSDDGINAWNKRKYRIDKENIYVIISDIDLSYKDIVKLGDIKCKKLIVMTAKKYDLEYCLYIPAFEGMNQVGALLGKTFSGKWKFEKYFDFVGWLNSDDTIAQHFYIGN